MLNFIHTLQINGADLVDTASLNQLSEKVQQLRSMPVNEALGSLLHDAIRFGINVVVALVIFYVGRWLIRRLCKVATRIMERREVELTVRTFLLNVITAVLTIFLLIMIISTLGISTTSFVALLSAVGLAIGLALSGTLQNFAGGVMILIFKPFRVGDYIETQGQAGTVTDIQITSTILRTPDNKTIMVPNGATSNAIVNNYSRLRDRRIEWVFEIPTGKDYDEIKSTIFSLLDEDVRILKSPAPYIAMQSLTTSTFKVIARA